LFNSQVNVPFQLNMLCYEERKDFFDCMTLRMMALRSFDRSVNCCQSSWRSVPEYMSV